MHISNPFLLNSFFFFFFFVVVISPLSSLSLSITDKIFLDCGSNETTNLHGRSWTGDIGSKFISHQDQSKTIISISETDPQEPGDSVNEIPYTTARLSRSEFSYSFPVTPGPKFVRLYFYPASYHGGFDKPKSFFSVKSGPFILLNNFSASLTADAQLSPTVVKEFCVYVDKDQKLSLTFTPNNSFPGSFAFVNGIEVVSVPENLYYSKDGDLGFMFVGQDEKVQYRIEETYAFETVARFNVGGKDIPPEKDTGMFRGWEADDRYFIPAAVITSPFNLTIDLNFSEIPSYSAPEEVYRTSRTMGRNKEINVRNNLTWEIPVDSGFTYFLRLHFCSLQPEIMKAGDRVFNVYVSDQSVEYLLDLYAETGGNGIPIYRNYAVLMAGEEEEGRSSKKRNLSISLQAGQDCQTSLNDAVLNGIELFKLNSSNNLAGLNPDPVLKPQPQPTPMQASKKSKKFLIIVIAGVIVAALFVVMVVSRLMMKPKNTTASSTDKTSRWTPMYSYETKSTTTRDSRNSSLPSNLCHHFSLAEIKAATQNFDDLFIIGSGGFGNVYKGYLHGGATPVAIKRLKSESQQGAREFLNEIHMLSQLRHVHLVSLVGYCDEDKEMILVYDYMAQGTLRDHLYKTENPPLPWEKRLQICIHAARGLLYLHTGAKNIIIHRDVKTTNILLDEKWVAKVADFGLSRLGPTTVSKAHVSTTVKGTIGYLDPEYYKRQQLSEKSDVYSFGVVLLEVLCGRPPIKRTKEKAQVSLVQWAKLNHSKGTIDRIVDPSLDGQISPQCLEKYLEIAFACISKDGINRPSMNDVCWSLEFALQLQGNMRDRVFQASPENNGSEAFTSNDEKSTTSSSERSQNLISSVGSVFSEIVNPGGR